jgi:hypothetical protein
MIFFLSGQLIPSFVLGALSIFFLYAVYDVTRSYTLDEEGVALHGIFGEIKRIAWQDIAYIKARGSFDPGMNIVGRRGEKIAISVMINDYLGLLDKVMDRLDSLAQEAQFQAEAEASAPDTAGQEFEDFEFRTGKLQWIGNILALLIAVVFVYAAWQIPVWYYILIAVLAVFVMIPVQVITFLRQPVRIYTKSDHLFIQFRSSRMRKTLDLIPEDTLKICLENYNIATQKGLGPQALELQIHFHNRKKIVFYQLKPSNEAVFLKLVNWIETFGKQPE